MKIMRLVFALVVSTALLGVKLPGQSFFMASKAQYFYQIAASGAVASPLQSYIFNASAQANALLTLPDSTTRPFTLNPNDNSYRINQTFLSKTALDAAFPNGTYLITGSGLPTLTLSMTSDNYPAVTPQVTSATNGTWNSGGLLVINPTQSATINFSPFSGYASAGVAGHMSFNVYGTNNSDPVALKTDIISQAISGVSSTVQATPLTSYTIPAGTLTSGRVYRAYLVYETASALNTSVLPGSVVGSTFIKELDFYLAAQNAGTSSPPPVITSQPASCTNVLGGTATFSVSVTVGGVNWTSVQNNNYVISWYHDGAEMNLSAGTASGKYACTGDILTINSLTSADAGNYSVVFINTGGIAASSQAALTLTVASAPAFTTQPASATVLSGYTASFTVAASGNPAPTYQWYKGGVAISGATSATYTIGAVNTGHAGLYTAVASNSAGTATSTTATLTVTTLAAPTITAQPRGATLNAGSTLALTVAASGNPALTYQWYKNGAGISGATSDTLVLSNVGASAAGSYTVYVFNSQGGVTSSAAVVVVTSDQPSRLPNLSVRTNLGTSQVLIVGFVSNGPKNMLVRGVGPTLASYGLTGVLPDPTIELYNSVPTKIDENNDWSASLSSVFSDVGAFPLTGGSKDAALRRTCSGAHTAQIKSTGSGVVLVEVYDTGDTGKLVNVSARSAVGTGNNILIAGFVVDGTAAKTLLIRGVGAKLAEYGVTGVLADPKLEIYTDAGVKIAENDSWNALIQPVAHGIGAFDLTIGSRDAALLITLPPGIYTAQISGVGATTGEAIVEVYEVP